jgi:hypothetical protein
VHARLCVVVHIFASYNGILGTLIKIKFEYLTAPT